MKKIIYLLLFSILLLFLVLTIPCFADENPIYDPNYNNKAGAFYANGTPITISQSSENESETVISWDSQKVTVPKTVTVFGGSSKGENCNSSNITMESGEVLSIVGGGISTEQGSLSTVQNASIIVNGGIVSGNIVGGGYLYATVDDSEITVNNGIIEGIYGGGLASVMIDSRSYTVGNEKEAKQSPNRVDKVDIVINNVTISHPSFPGGYIYGGGQSYSYVGESNLTINGGDYTKADITAGGLDGYTEASNVKIKGGTIKSFQTIKKGTLNSVTVTITAGAITNFYVGGKTEDTSSTGIISKAQINLLVGTIEKLEAGKNNSTSLEIDKQNYIVTKTQSFIIKNNRLKENSIIPVIYDIEISPKIFSLKIGETQKIDSVISITPIEYEYLFTDYLLWESDDSSIAEVTENGEVSAIDLGQTKIRALLLDESEIAQVTVEDNNSSEFNIILLLSVLIGLVLFGIVVSIFA